MIEVKKMPGFVIHMIHGNYILQRSGYDWNDEMRNSFMVGILMPDSETGSQKDISHFLLPDSENKILRVPEPDSFAAKYRQFLTEPFVIAYLAHLWLDKQFFEKFFPIYVHFLSENGKVTTDKDHVNQVYLPKQNQYISVDELFSESFLYGDYTALNARFIAEHHLKIPDKAEIENPIEEVNIKNFSRIRSDLEHYFSLPESDISHLKIFSKDVLEHFLMSEAANFLAYYEKKEGF